MSFSRDIFFMLSSCTNRLGKTCDTVFFTSLITYLTISTKKANFRVVIIDNENQKLTSKSNQCLWSYSFVWEPFKHDIYLSLWSIRSSYLWGILGFLYRVLLCVVPQLLQCPSERTYRVLRVKVIIFIRNSKILHNHILQEHLTILATFKWI